MSFGGAPFDVGDRGSLRMRVDDHVEGAVESSVAAGDGRMVQPEDGNRHTLRSSTMTMDRLE